MVFTVPPAVAEVAAPEQGRRLRPALPHRRPERCAPSPPTRATSAPRSASSPCCTPGARRSSTIPTCTASSPVGASPTTAAAWVACRPGFFLPVRVLSRYFRRVLLAALEDAFESGQLHFAGRLQPLADPRRFAEHLRPGPQDRMGRLRQAALRRPRAGPRLPRSLHPPDRHQQPAPTQPRRRLGALSLHRLPPQRRVAPQDHDAGRRPSSYAACCSTCCRPAFTGSAITGSSPTAPESRSWPSAGGCSDTPPPAPAEQTDRENADYRDRFEALTGRSLRQCPTATQATCNRSTSPPAPGRIRPSWIRRDSHIDVRQARFRSSRSRRGRSTCVCDPPDGLHDHLRGQRRRPRAAADLPASPPPSAASAVCSRSNAHRTATSGGRFRSNAVGAGECGHHRPGGSPDSTILNLRFHSASSHFKHGRACAP